MKRDERVKGARECTGEEGDFHSLSLSMLILSPSSRPPCPLPATSLPSSSYSHGISVLPSVCLSVTVTYKIVTLVKRHELLTNGLDRFVATCLLYTEAKFRDKIPAVSQAAQ